MSNKQTQCPECSTIYKVSVAQLTVAQGMVCCPKCNCHFNAVLHLIPLNANTQQSTQSAQQVKEPEEQPLYQQQVLDIFERKVEHSNIDLKTYLNNLNYFVHEPVTAFPTQTPLEKVTIPPPKRSLRYYLIWGLINLILFIFLTMQIIWFNPHSLQRHPLLNSGFEYLCVLVSCPNLDERYAQIQIQQLHVRTHQGKTIFSGQLINHYQRSLPLPLLQISLEDHSGQTTRYTLTANEYLDKKYLGIARIPSKSPFKFSFELERPKNSFKNHVLEIIKP